VLYICVVAIFREVILKDVHYIERKKLFDVLCICVVTIFREVILKDVLHRTSNNCLMCYVFLLWTFSGR